MLKELTHILGMDLKYYWLVIISSFTFGGFLGFIETYLWSPPEAYFILVLLLGADFISGISVAGKHNRIETRKAFRILWKMIAFSAMLFFAHNLAAHDPYLEWLPEAVFLPITLILFTSFIKNLSLLGLVNKTIAEALYKRIDVYKNPVKPTDKPDGNQ